MHPLQHTDVSFAACNKKGDVPGSHRDDKKYDNAEKSQERKARRMAEEMEKEKQEES